MYRHPWSHVVIGMWHKYPNPHCSHVQTIDVLDRSVDPETGVIRTERILGCTQKAPGWIVKVCGYLSMLEILVFICLSSFLVVRRMLSYGKSHSLTPPRKKQPLPLSTFHYPNSPPVTKISAMRLQRTADIHHSTKQRKFKHEWPFGEVQQIN